MVIIVTSACYTQQTATPERDGSSSHLPAILLNKDQFYLSGIIDFESQHLHSYYTLSCARRGRECTCGWCL